MSRTQAAPRPKRSVIVEGIVKNGKAIAQASGLEVSAEELERIAAPLDALESAFRPLVKDLAPELEPATAFHADEGTE